MICAAYQEDERGDFRISLAARERGRGPMRRSPAHWSHVQSLYVLIAEGSETPNQESAVPRDLKGGSGTFFIPAVN